MQNGSDCSQQYASIWLLNIQSLSPSASSNSRWKLCELRSNILEQQNKGNVIPFIAITETWLDSHITDAQVNIPSYIVSRSDRGGRGGGVLLFSLEKITLAETITYDDKICQALACKFQTLNMLVVVVYRPPDAPKQSFAGVIRWFRRILEDYTDLNYQVVLLGDFNFPCIDWRLGSVMRNASVDVQQSAHDFLNLLADLFMNQYVFSPTRYNNVLDLFVTDNPYLVTNVSCTDTEMSDHRLVEIMVSMTVYPPVNETKPRNRYDFYNLDFSRADFDLLSSKFLAVEWSEMFASCSFEEFPTLFALVVLQICLEFVPFKRFVTGRPQQLNALRRRKRRLLNRLNKLKMENGNPNHVLCLESKIFLISYEIKEVIMNHLSHRENTAVQKIKTNPKVFYSYAKAHSNIKSRLSMLYSQSGDVVSDGGGMADILQDQFSSVFSDPSSSDLRPPSFDSPDILFEMSESDFILNDQDIIDAISDIRTSSSAGPDGLPAVLLKSCA